LLIKGSARLAYEDGEKISLKEGDHINIPAHTKHRLDWTDPEQDTVWLLVYY
jgi:cupin 2 domain-containing protein